MNRYETMKNLLGYAHMMEKSYAAISKTLFGAVRKMEAEADVIPKTPLSESLKNVTWKTYFYNSNFSSFDDFAQVVSLMETEPLPGVPNYEILAAIAESDTHDSFQQKADTALSVLGANGICKWMLEHADERGDAVVVRNTDDDALIGALCLTEPIDMGVIGKLCIRHPELAPVLSMILNGGD